MGVPAAARAYSKGTISGTITDASGAVAGARISPVLGSYAVEGTTTDAGGHFQIEVWPGTYQVGVWPSNEAADGFRGASGIVVTESAVTNLDLQLPGPGGSAHLSGVANYGDGQPDAGVEVAAYPLRYEPGGPFRSMPATTDEGGHWDLGALPPGLYSVAYSVVTGGSIGSAERAQLTQEAIIVESGESKVLSTTLSGPRPLGLVSGTVMNAEGWGSREARVDVTPAGGGGSLGSVGTDRSGHFQFSAPAGSYTLTATGGEDEDDGTGSTTISTSNGHVTNAGIQLPAQPVPAGTTAHHEQEILGYLNGQRARWGLPAGLQAVPVWSQACSAHDVYGAKNGVLEHPEQAGKPGHSVGGQWAGEHAVLAAGSAWSAWGNPWMDAPIHLNQLFTPDLSHLGLDETEGHQCATTWPGMLRERPALGTIYTFPGDGTSGIPPVERAGESPETPNEALGIGNLAGRQLFVYEVGTETFDDGYARMHVTAASLTAADGSSVPLKWLDQTSALGGYLTGAIIVPVQPLRPFTTYTATVSLADVESFYETVPPIPAQTYSWSFSTGRDNPDGSWGETRPKSTKTAPRRVAIAKWRHHRIIVKGWHFKRGRVVIKRKVLLRSKRRLNGQVMARARVNRKGKFFASFRWPEKRHIALRIYQGGKSTSAIFTPPHPPGWYHRHHKHNHR